MSEKPYPPQGEQAFLPDDSNERVENILVIASLLDRKLSIACHSDQTDLGRRPYKWAHCARRHAQSCFHPKRRHLVSSATQQIVISIENGLICHNFLAQPTHKQDRICVFSQHCAKWILQFFALFYKITRRKPMLI